MHKKQTIPHKSAFPIGVFDSGYGGLTILKEMVKELPKHDFLYLGDNARSPYGTRSFEIIYNYTLEAVQYLFAQGCQLVILACNTASAKALRTIQQNDLPKIAPDKRVLGVIRPTTEVIGQLTNTQQIGVLGTSGTVRSGSYVTEIKRSFPEMHVFQQACPMWVPLIENGELDSPGTDYFIKKYLKELLNQSADIDTVLLACTHYPLFYSKIREFISKDINILSQGTFVAKSLKEYLQRNPEIHQYCSQHGCLTFQTTGEEDEFNQQASLFFGQVLQSKKIEL